MTALRPSAPGSRVEDEVEIGQLGGVDDSVDVMDPSGAQGKGERAEDASVAQGDDRGLLATGSDSSVVDEPGPR